MSFVASCLLSVIHKQWLEQLRHPIVAYDHIPDRFYVISMKFLLLSRNVPQRR